MTSAASARAGAGADYRERSCQDIPPSGAPGSVWRRSPVRRSICSIAAQVEAVDQDRVDAPRPAARRRAYAIASTTGMNISRRAVQQPIRLGARVQVDRADDPERRDLEGHVVGDLVDLVGGPLRVGQRRQRRLAGEHDDQVVRVDGLEARRVAPARAEPSIGAHWTFAIVIGSRLLSASDRRPRDVHPADEPPLLGQAVERDAAAGARRRGRRAGRRSGAVAAGRLGLALFRKSNGTPFLRGAGRWSGSSPRPRHRRASWCRRAGGPRPMSRSRRRMILPGPRLGQVRREHQELRPGDRPDDLGDVLAQFRGQRVVRPRCRP